MSYGVTVEYALRALFRWWVTGSVVCAFVMAGIALLLPQRTQFAFRIVDRRQCSVLGRDWWHSLRSAIPKQPTYSAKPREVKLLAMLWRHQRPRANT